MCNGEEEKSLQCFCGNCSKNVKVMRPEVATCNATCNTGEKIPQIFWRGICMVIAISIINENPNVVILWFSEADPYKCFLKSTMGLLNLHLYHGYERNQVKNVNFHVWKTVWYPAMAIENSTVISTVIVSKLFQFGFLNSINGNCSKL